MSRYIRYLSWLTEFWFLEVVHPLSNGSLNVSQIKGWCLHLWQFCIFHPFYAGSDFKILKVYKVPN